MTPEGGAPAVGDLLVEAGLVTAEELEQARLEADRTGAPVVGVLMRRTALAPGVYLESLRRRLGVELFDPARASVDVAAARMLDAALAARHHVIPVAVVERAGRRVLRLAMVDPLDAAAVAAVEAATGCAVEPLLAAPDVVESAIGRHYNPGAAPAPEERPRRGGRRSGEVRSTDTRLAALRAVDLHRPTPAQRVTALVNLLVDKGLIDYEEYERAVRALLKPDGP